MGIDKNTDKIDKFIRTLIYFSLVFILAYMVGQAMDLQLGFLRQLGTSLLISAIVKFFLIKPVFFYSISLASLIIGLTINHYFPFVQGLFDLVAGFFSNIFAYLAGREDLLGEYSLWFWGLLLILIGLYTGYIIFREKRVAYLLPLYALSLIYYWYVFYNLAYFLLALVFFLYLILLGLERYSLGRLMIRKINRVWLRSLISYSFLIISLALLIPKVNNYIHWAWLENQAYGLFPGMEDWRSMDTSYGGEGQAGIFDLSRTGYQGQGPRLGGPVRISDKKVMTVYGQGPFYLRGNVRHSYTGQSWENAHQPDQLYLSGQKIDIIPNKERKFYDYKTVTIRNHYFSSSSLFSPYSPETVYLDGNYEIYLNSDFQLFFPAGRYTGEKYRIKTLEPRPYAQLLELGRDARKADLKKLDQYLQLPRSKISSRVKELSKEIVKESRSDYEKALAIEDYLRNNFKYETDVEMPPRNREFVDYFLFDGQEGYCSYYATAMAVMLRLEGIPTRYVEGYVARELIDKDTYLVRQRNGHAWVEAFIEPVGWMAFEPTPAYRPPARSLEGSLIIEREERDEGLWDFDVLDPFGEGPRLDLGRAGSDDQESQEDHGEDEIPSPEAGFSIREILKILLLGACLVFILRLLAKFIKSQILRIRIARLPHKDRLIYEYSQILKLTAALGYPMVAGETHYEYADRIASRFSTLGQMGIREITDIFVRHKYSSKETREEHVAEMLEYKQVLRRRLRKG